jgi:phage protein D
MDLFIWFPIIIIAACGLAGLIVALADASDKIDRITQVEESNVYEFPTRATDYDGDDIA